MCRQWWPRWQAVPAKVGTDGTFCSLWAERKEDLANEGRKTGKWESGWLQWKGPLGGGCWVMGGWRECCGFWVLDQQTTAVDKQLPAAANPALPMALQLLGFCAERFKRREWREDFGGLASSGLGIRRKIKRLWKSLGNSLAAEKACWAVKCFCCCRALESSAEGK